MGIKEFKSGAHPQWLCLQNSLFIFHLYFLNSLKVILTMALTSPPTWLPNKNCSVNQTRDLVSWFPCGHMGVQGVNAVHKRLVGFLSLMH